MEDSLITTVELVVLIVGSSFSWIKGDVFVLLVQPGFWGREISQKNPSFFFLFSEGVLVEFFAILEVDFLLNNGDEGFC